MPHTIEEWEEVLRQNEIPCEKPTKTSIYSFMENTQENFCMELRIYEDQGIILSDIHINTTRIERHTPDNSVMFYVQRYKSTNNKSLV